MKRFVLFCTLAGAAFVGCQSPPPASQTFNFDRPSSVAHVCLDVQLTADGHLVPNPTFIAPRPLVACRTDPATNRPTGGMQSDANGVHGNRLFALVPQSDRGELAVVNLHPELDTGILDNNRRVPGFTFIPVGAFPRAVAVDPRGTVTYVANAGEPTITAIDNTRILGSGPHRVQNASGEFVRYELPANPGDVAVTELGGRFFLYATLPSAGALYVCDVTDEHVPGPTMVVSLRGGEAGHGLDGGVGIDGGDSEGGVGSAARPFDLAIDAEGTIYVSDERQPFIHVLENQGGTLVERARERELDSGVPTRAIAVSPRLPVPINGNPQLGTRFVYAVSALDGTVLVLDADSGRRQFVNAVDEEGCRLPAPADPSRCRRIDPKLPFDRVPLVAPATDVAFSTRGLDSSDCTGLMAPVDCNSTNDPNLGPRSLRGLHALVTLRTGQLEVVDIFDADRPCRTATEQGLPPAQPHLPRARDPMITPPTLSAPPALTLNGGTIAASTDQPRIASPTDVNATCDATNNFCIDLPPGRGATPNAWAVPNDTFTLTFRGALPNLSANGGDFRVDPALPADQIRFVAPSAGFCRNGALAGDTLRLPAVGPTVMDTGFDAGLREPDDAGTGERCRLVFGTTAAPCNRELQIVSATQDELVLRVPSPERACSPSDLTTAEALRTELDRCYPQATRFEVHAGNEWVVVSQRLGYQHDVTVGDDGQCRRGALDIGRIREGEVYPRGYNPDPRAPAHTSFPDWPFALRILPGGTGQALPTTPGTAFTFTTTGGVAPLLLDAGALPVNVRYVCPNERAYVIDQSRNSLIEYPVSPIDSTTGVRRFN